jgi:hypothetical protein
MWIMNGKLETVFSWHIWNLLGGTERSSRDSNQHPMNTEEYYQ